MKKNNQDRRSLRTRQMLHSALMELMLAKRYDSITVQDIIDRANVGRSTFYFHYCDKEDLAVSSLEEMLDHLSEHLEADDPESKRIIPILELFQHVQEHQHVFKAMIRGRGIDLFFEKGQAYWSRKIESRLRERLSDPTKPHIPLPIVSNFISGTSVTLLKWWLDNKMPYSPEQMDEIFHQLVTPGIRAALGKS